MTSNTKSQAGASLLTTEQIDAIRERFHQGDMPSRGLVQRIASLITLSSTTPQADAAIAAGGAQEVANVGQEVEAAVMRQPRSVDPFPDMPLCGESE
jgi:hypothetical protein